MSAPYTINDQQGRHIIFVQVLDAMRSSPNNGRVTNVGDLPPPAPFFSSASSTRLLSSLAPLERSVHKTFIVNSNCSNSSQCQLLCPVVARGSTAVCAERPGSLGSTVAKVMVVNSQLL
jgi:hypothetical protein